uniref:Uncharacterized protein n=1 Tax=Chromera velia CCMP2878 TaxID=1169474 RepID=A0A0G4F504_9ALVE|eukprot:Cvel_15110.t1-p1 / transcript=Cvel_15110.t1 / gene=Cvel_15110 / organism=Chromera_velia_CCMP2878 / gene_product=hypothetical protein / transcript_product=hypothetical protein / location=Cvel_scaffold1102:53514-53939(-) / protein_length=142 / sequence_SO=supercontig / SO=protein_coding / is_pseudo=false
MVSLQLSRALAGPDAPLRAPRVDQKRKNKFVKFMEWVIPKMEAELGSNFRWKRPINCFAPPTSLVWAIRDDHVISFLNHLGFGIEEPKKRDLPTKKYTSSTLWDTMKGKQASIGDTMKSHQEKLGGSFAGGRIEGHWGSGGA